MTTWRDTPTKTIAIDGTPFAYRELGDTSGVPVVFLHHFTAVLDDWDPRVIDGIAAQQRVIERPVHKVLASVSQGPGWISRGSPDLWRPRLRGPGEHGVGRRDGLQRGNDKFLSQLEV